jgi:hypothetical protein
MLQLQKDYNFNNTPIEPASEVSFTGQPQEYIIILKVLIKADE